MSKKNKKTNKEKAVVIPGASDELKKLLGDFRVSSSEMRRTLGRPAKLYVRMEEIVKPTLLQVKG